MEKKHFAIKVYLNPIKCIVQEAKEVTHLRMTPSNRHDILGAKMKLAYKNQKCKKAHK